MAAIEDVSEKVVDWSGIRARYRAVHDGVFLNAGSRGVMSEETVRAVELALRAERDVVPPQPDFSTQLAETRHLFERLLKARAGTVAITKNTSEGLNTVANAIDWRAGDNVVLSSGLEHANNVYLWMRLARLGVEIRDVPDRSGTLDAARFAQAVDSRTRLVTAPAVSFVPGFRTDMALIGEACRRHDALFLVDGVQACGILDLDVEALGVTAFATSTSKGLCGLRGLGALYVAPEWIERLDPAYVARNSIEAGGRHYSEFEPGNSTLSADARRFEWGTYNYLGIAAARNSLTEILTLGTTCIEARATGLASALANGLADLGLPVQIPADGAAPTHLVTVGERGRGDATTTGIAFLDRLAAALADDGVRFSIRRGLIRFGFNFYNDETDLDRVLEIAGKTARES